MINTHFENVNCIICHSKKNKILYSFDISAVCLNIVKCDCSFIYLNPRPTSKHISSYYTEDYLPHKKHPFFNFLQMFTFFWKKNIIEKYASQNNNILDVGAGDASFGKYMSKHGYSVDSYDKYSKQALSKIPTKKKYDIITFWHSIEHFHDINELFSDLSKTTHNNTIFIIALPNFNAIDRKIFKHKWIAFDVPRHLYHFSSYSLSKYLDKKNISIINKHRMIQDTFFNIYLTLNNNFIFKILITPIIVFYSLFFILININNSSSLLYICKKNF